MAARKKRSSKQDEHSFAVKPDEIAGPFPEQVLLKKKTVQQDGKSVPEFADAEEEKLDEFLSLQLESNLNLERMRHYEVVYLIHEDHFDDVETVISKVQESVREKKGRIWRLNNWGLRTLAYKIKKAKKANYVLMNFELDAKYLNDFKTMLDKDERIIRHLVMKRDEAETEDCPPPPELHTLKAFMDEEDEDEFEYDYEDEDDEYEDEDDEYEDEDKDYDDQDEELELEMAGYEDNQDDADENVIIIEEEEGDDDGSGLSLKKAMGLKSAR